MSFGTAISDGFSKYATFTGRSSRSAYWWWALFAFLVGVVSYGVSLALGTMIPYWIAALALFLPGLAVSVRRLHDIGRSGWWYLLILVPIIGAIVLIVWAATASDGPNEYGQGPDNGAPATVGTPGFAS